MSGWGDDWRGSPEEVPVGDAEAGGGAALLAYLAVALVSVLVTAGLLVAFALASGHLH